jgi:hypothetical protein
MRVRLLYLTLGSRLFHGRKIERVIHAFHDEGPKPLRKPRSVPADSRARAAARAFHCLACITRVCDESALISVAGGTQHRFVNPAGCAFVIACFASASCAVAGEPTLEHTWFPGHAWSIANCRNCGRQLGWLFAGATHFYGLILDRLIFGA